jgi:hypothetical protein
MTKQMTPQEPTQNKVSLPAIDGTPPISPNKRKRKNSYSNIIKEMTKTTDTVRVPELVICVPQKIDKI